MENTNLCNARNAKSDEFYTLLKDIADELNHYKGHFRNKIVLCNCDNPESSNFWRYFHLNFAELGLKKLIATFYSTDVPVYKMEYAGCDDDDIKSGVITYLEGNGDFRSEECLDVLDEADIVVTNPPFSLFREYFTTLIEHKKSFLIWGNNNAITYRDVFPLLQSNLVWLGCTVNKTCTFRVGSGYEYDEKLTNQINDGYKYGKVSAISIFTNLDHDKRYEPFKLSKCYHPSEYPKYDNYDAIEVKRTELIPGDYDGIMGVPITFLGKYNSEQFEIVGFANGNFRTNASDELKKLLNYTGTFKDKGGCPLINGRLVYPRILIRRKQ